MSAVSAIGDVGWHHMGGGAGWIWIPMMLLVVAALVAVIVVALRAAAHVPATSPEQPDEGRTARVIAMERYARGEISADEYDTLLHRLR